MKCATVNSRNMTPCGLDQFITAFSVRASLVITNRVETGQPDHDTTEAWLCIYILACISVHLCLDVPAVCCCRHFANSMYAYVALFA